MPRRAPPAEHDHEPPVVGEGPAAEYATSAGEGDDGDIGVRANLRFASLEVRALLRPRRVVSVADQRSRAAELRCQLEDGQPAEAPGPGGSVAVRLDRIGGC